MQEELLLDFYIQITQPEKGGRYCVAAGTRRAGEHDEGPQIAAFTTWDEAVAFGRQVVEAVAETFQTRRMMN